LTNNASPITKIVNMKLHTLLTDARSRAKLTLRALEAKTGISNAVLSQTETGHIVEPSFRNVIKIARALDIPLTKLAETD
jgi:HTH-type transcriptional regulator, competence development regulator